MKRTAFLFIFTLQVLFLALAQAEESPPHLVLDPKDEKALRELEEHVTELKESVFKTKTRLHELEEAVLEGRITGSKALIVFQNEAEGLFHLSEASFYIDDELVKKVLVEGDQKAPPSINAFDREIPSGDHVLRVELKYVGSDRSLLRPLTYFKDHVFKLQSREQFPVEYGKTTQVKLTALDKGYFKTKFEERLFLKVEILQDWGTETPE